MRLTRKAGKSGSHARAGFVKFLAEGLELLSIGSGFDFAIDVIFKQRHAQLALKRMDGFRETLGRHGHELCRSRIASFAISLEEIIDLVGVHDPPCHDATYAIPFRPLPLYALATIGAKGSFDLKIDVFTCANNFWLQAVLQEDVWYWATAGPIVRAVRRQATRIAADLAQGNGVWHSGHARHTSLCERGT